MYGRITPQNINVSKMVIRCLCLSASFCPIIILKCYKIYTNFRWQYVIWRWGTRRWRVVTWLYIAGFQVTTISHGWWATWFIGFRDICDKYYNGKKILWPIFRNYTMKKKILCHHYFWKKKYGPREITVCFSIHELRWYGTSCQCTS